MEIMWLDLHFFAVGTLGECVKAKLHPLKQTGGREGGVVITLQTRSISILAINK